MSNFSHNTLSFGIKNDVILIIAVGNMRAADIFALNEYLLPYIDHVHDLKRIFIDLNKCDYMDSTFIGFITALTIKCRRQSCDIIHILHPSDNAKASLRALSTMPEINFTDEAPVETIPVFKILSKGSFDSRKNIELMFEAHKILSELSEENRVEFSDLLAELNRVLTRNTAGGTA